MVLFLQQALAKLDIAKLQITLERVEDYVLQIVVHHIATEHIGLVLQEMTMPLAHGKSVVAMVASTIQLSHTQTVASVLLLHLDLANQQK